MMEKTADLTKMKKKKRVAAAAAAAGCCATRRSSSCCNLRKTPLSVVFVCGALLGFVNMMGWLR